MQFNSYAFLFGFLPPTVAGYFLLLRWAGRRAALAWLLFASIAFYLYDSPLGLAFILPSIGLDFLLARAMLRLDAMHDRLRGILFAAGVVANLALLGYFKYRNFFLDSSNTLLGTHFALRQIILPLGISFLTFQKIAFLADVRSGQLRRVSLFDFLLFTLFFPRTVAGPIVHFDEVMPELRSGGSRPVSSDLAVAIALFSMGLAKKTLIADNLGQFVSPAFDASSSQTVTLLTAWIAALAYTFQVYFDFSGYSDMALACARIFGVRLPMNFNSPLKARNIVEFWGHWHITLTRFLTSYIYTPIVMPLTRRRLARNRPVLRGKRSSASAIAALVAAPTLITMALSGLWHGAAAQFVVWGSLHGAYLTINQSWRMLRPRFWPDDTSYARVMRPLALPITFFSVVVAMVFFRARSVGSAVTILGSMVGRHGLSIPHALGDRLGGLGHLLQGVGITYDWSSGSQFVMSFCWIIGLLGVTLLLPNSLELLRRYEPAFDFTESSRTPRGAPARTTPAAGEHMRAAGVAGWLRLSELREHGLPLSPRTAGAAALLALGGLLALGRGTGFIYWQF